METAGMGSLACRSLSPLEGWGSQRTTQVCAWTIFREQGGWLLRVLGGAFTFCLCSTLLH